MRLDNKDIFFGHVFPGMADGIINDVHHKPLRAIPFEKLVAGVSGASLKKCRGVVLE